MKVIILSILMLSALISHAETERPAEGTKSHQGDTSITYVKIQNSNGGMFEIDLGKEVVIKVGSFDQHRRKPEYKFLLDDERNPGKIKLFQDWSNASQFKFTINQKMKEAAMVGRLGLWVYASYEGAPIVPIANYRDRKNHDLVFLRLSENGKVESHQEMHSVPIGIYVNVTEGYWNREGYDY